LNILAENVYQAKLKNTEEQSINERNKLDCLLPNLHSTCEQLSTAQGQRNPEKINLLYSLRSEPAKSDTKANFY